MVFKLYRLYDAMCLCSHLEAPATAHLAPILALDLGSRWLIEDQGTWQVEAHV